MSTTDTIHMLFSLAAGFAVLVGGFYAYFAPTIVARRRHHRARDAILATNLLFGWTFIGWCIALIWALAQPKQGSQS